MEDSFNAVQKACKILSSFTFEEDSCSLVNICCKTGFAKSTVHRICATLVEEGFLVKSASSSKYSLTPKVFELGSIAIQSLDIKSIASNHMLDIAQNTGETARLFIENNFERICIHAAESPSQVRLVAPLGIPLPLYLGATGRVLVAWMEEGRREQFLTFLRNSPPTSFLGTIDQLTEKIIDTRKKGYAVSFGERLSDIISVAAPVFYGNNKVAALSISGPSYRFTDTKLQECINMVLETAGIINIQLR